MSFFTKCSRSIIFLSTSDRSTTREIFRRRRHGEVIALLQPSAELVQRQCGRIVVGADCITCSAGVTPLAERVRVEEAEQNCSWFKTAQRSSGSLSYERYIGHAIV